MGEETKIQWCDSTLNLEMGCSGCELWVPEAGVRRCYAGTMTEKHAGKRPGWPLSFAEPAVFPERMKAAEKWRDLRGTKRKDKPWLDRMPRMIFLNDMGDTFSEGLPTDWLSEFLGRMEATPHVYLLLTKRPHRMADFSRRCPLPPNVWPGVSVTGGNNAESRVRSLGEVIGGGPRWLSVEPMTSPIQPGVLLASPVGWVIVGGESSQGGQVGRAFDLRWARSIKAACRSAGVPFFLKQLGSTPVDESGPVGSPVGGRLMDHHGGDPTEWPDDLLNSREVPFFSG